MYESKGLIDKTTMKIPAGNHLDEIKSHCFTLKLYRETPVLILVVITEDALKLVAQKRFGGTGPSGMYSAAL